MFESKGAWYMAKKTLRPNELTEVLGREAFDKIGLATDMAQWNEYRKKYDAVSRLEMVTDFPIQIDVELNPSCNLKCPQCPISAESPSQKGPSTWTSLQEFSDWIPKAVALGLRSLKLNYINEPLIREDLPSFVAKAKEAGVLDVYLSTNGTLLSSSMSEQLIDAGLSRIQISIDATTEETYEKMRPGGSLRKVQKNVFDLLEIRRQKNKNLPLIRVNFLDSKSNEHELAEFIRKWQGQVDQVGIQQFIQPPHEAGVISEESSLKRHSHFRCSFPFKQLVINSEKQILPCCTFWGEKLPLGEFSGIDSLQVAWTSEAMKRLRQVHKDGNYHLIEACRNCVRQLVAES